MSNRGHSNEPRLDCPDCGAPVGQAHRERCSQYGELSDAEIADLEKAFASHNVRETQAAPGQRERKPSNPKQGLGVLKWAISCFSFQVLANACLGMLEGALKYGRHNYRLAGVRASVYVDATIRHIAAYWEGEDLDPDSKAGLHHIDKAIASLMVMRDAMLIGKFTDDRPPKSPAGWQDLVNAKVKLLLEAYPNPKEPFTALGETTLLVDPKTSAGSP